ncbi:cysteine--tRNA ligase [uncultured Sphingomonas sp.]|uniref:cysteine--tRNA ligase n=1 Tax=uncultured Sphingomonas sp. TaxID=158754 RepID=UPI0025DEB03C|nr:cysteine--tRNA ligase [uncultured Sphingomonas sp.]
MIRLYDTMTREKREFTPGEPGRITMYVCGPTVYGRAHIGNARPAVAFDVLRRLLKHSYPEHQLTYARNITDVDDKIIEAVRSEGVAPEVITARYEAAYLDDMRALGVEDPDIAPHATQEIAAMGAMIGELVASGNAYAAEGHVLFDVSSDPHYGVLSRRDREAMLAGARVEVAPYKRNPGDFVLWKPSATDVIGWESPWGRGRPGWHIECSAMIRQHLGETIDIHGGGIDLVFPHHENEAAQSRCAHGGKPLARYWMHNGFVDFGSEKMSKSLGNTVLVNELLSQGHRGEVLRLALLSAHYRQPLPWTESLIVQSKATLEGLQNALRKVQEVSYIEDEAPSELTDALEDDLNTPAAITALGRIRKTLTTANNEDAVGKAKHHMHVAGQLLGFGSLMRPISATMNMTVELKDFLNPAKFSDQVANAVIQATVDVRTEAKKRRDFAEADRIRDELKADGILLEDGPSGTNWRRA